MDLMKKFIDDEENILNVTVYKHPLRSWQWSQLILNHQFVVLETNKQWWWSIEKNCAFGSSTSINMYIIFWSYLLKLALNKEH